MAYDFDDSDPGPPRVSGPVAHPKDLEVIATLLELAALELSPTLGATFTRQQLLQLAREIGAPQVVPDERDLLIVLPHVSF